MDWLSSASSSSDDENDDKDSLKDCNQHCKSTAPDEPRHRGTVTLHSSSDPAAASWLIRSQPHVRGNWAIHVYLQVETIQQESLVQSIQSQLQDAGYSGRLLIHDQLHVSLHQHVIYLHSASVESFVAALRERFVHESCIVLATSSPLLQLTNETHTRTFFAVPMQSSNALMRWHNHVQSVLTKYNASETDDMTFHVSVASVPNVTVPKISVPIPPAAWRVSSIQLRAGTTRQFEIALADL